MEIRKFSPDLKKKIPGNHPGLYGVMIQRHGTEPAPETREEMARRFNGLPLLTESGTQIEAMYFEPHAAMEEHATDHPIFFLVIKGRGYVRLGGPSGETRAVQENEAVVWPAHLEHTVWTEEDELHAIVINAFTSHPL